MPVRVLSLFIKQTNIYNIYSSFFQKILLSRQRLFCKK